MVPRAEPPLVRFLPRLSKSPPGNSRLAGLLPDPEVIQRVEIAESPVKRAFRGVRPHPFSSLRCRSPSRRNRMPMSDEERKLRSGRARGMVSLPFLLLPRTPSSFLPSLPCADTQGWKATSLDNARKFRMKFTVADPSFSYSPQREKSDAAPLLHFAVTRNLSAGLRCRRQHIHWDRRRRSCSRRAARPSISSRQYIHRGP